MAKEKTKKRWGFTLTEVVFTVVMMGFCLLLGVSVVTLASKGAVGTELNTTIVREDARFADLLNKAIQESTTAFSVPKNSFNKLEKLTAGWNYLGLMERVHIPAEVSRTGEEMTADQALVYIEYIGTEAPSSVPTDCNLLQNEEGFFYQKILGHSFTDALGTRHEYSLVFEATNSTDAAAQTIRYEFSSNLTDKNGTPVGEEGTDIAIDTMLTALNAIQIVYKGSATNPAVALAFRGDYMPSDSASDGGGMPAATVVMVLDTSSSMSASLGSKTRIAALRENANDFVAQLAENDKINVIMVPFGTYAGDNGTTNYSWTYSLNQVNSSYWTGAWAYNASTGEPVGNKGRGTSTLTSRINGLNAYSGWTNVGDGLRRAYYEIGNLENSGVELGKVYLLLMTDGQMNTYSSTAPRGTTQNTNRYAPYNGSSVRPTYITNWNPDTRKKSIGESTAYARNYAQHWGELLVDEWAATGYLINLSGGMGAKDKEMLESVFETEAFEADSLTAFSEAFISIAGDLEKNLWAFEGPNM